MSWLSRALDFDDDATSRRRRIAAFEIVFILTVGIEYWCRALRRWNDLPPRYSITLAAATVLCTMALHPRLRRSTMLALSAVHIWLIAGEFPAPGNHAYLEVWIGWLIAFLNPKIEEEQRLLLVALRWTMVVVFFYSGLQKLVHGYYFYGQFFAASLSIESFRKLFEHLLPADEMQRLLSYDEAIGAGPYAFRSPLAIFLSNAVWITEILGAPLLLVRRVRPIAVAAIIALLISIEVGAREVFFGLIFLNGILLFARAELHQRSLPLFAVFLLALLLIRLGVLPEVIFH